MTEATTKRKGSTLCSDPDANCVEIAKIFGYDAKAKKRLKFVTNYGNYTAGEEVTKESVNEIWPGCSKRVSIESRRIVWLLLYKAPPTQVILQIDDEDSLAYGMCYIGSKSKFMKGLKEQDPSLPAEYLEEYAANVVAKNAGLSSKAVVDTSKSVCVPKAATLAKTFGTEWVLASGNQNKCWKFSDQSMAENALKIASAYSKEAQLLEIESL